MSPRISIAALVVLVCSLFPSSPEAQSPASTQPLVTITGTVVDGALTPVASVDVRLEQNGATMARTASDAAGKFMFNNVTPGTYVVRAAKSGFPAMSRNVRVPRGMSIIRLPLVLARADQPLTVAQPAGSGATAGRTLGVGQPAVGPPPPPVAMPTPPAASTASSAVATGGGRGGTGQGRGSGSGSGTGTANVAQERLMTISPRAIADAAGPPYEPGRGEGYAAIDPNRFESARNKPLSTFGADVDTASYANVRRFLSTGQMPPRDAVRVEELINYFHFAYVEPQNGRPIAITSEVGECPWAPTHKLVLIGARANTPVRREIEGRNIVLLIDVSGSMAPPQRLPMIQSALRMFVQTLKPEDRIALVTYAGWSGVVLPSTPARDRDVIDRAITNLGAGGSTNGAQGILTAYRVARESYIPGGINRVILATDGDFNVGVVNRQDLLHLIEREKESGVFLSVFGVGEGNLQDATMEMLADKGNGHYAYLDSIQEARRVLIDESASTLETVAKDVKFQVEFNPAVVSSWKLIGYENRLLASKDFNDDTKDGGELGAGHTVTVLYEIVPVGVSAAEDERGARPQVDPLRYQPATPTSAATAQAAPSAATRVDELLTVKARYKTPEGDISELLSAPVRNVTTARPQFLPLASAVAEYGLLLRSQSRDRARWDRLWNRVRTLAVADSMAADKIGFNDLVSIARGLAR